MRDPWRGDRPAAALRTVELRDPRRAHAGTPVVWRGRPCRTGFHGALSGAGPASLPGHLHGTPGTLLFDSRLRRADFVPCDRATRCAQTLKNVLSTPCAGFFLFRLIANGHHDGHSDDPRLDDSTRNERQLTVAGTRCGTIADETMSRSGLGEYFRFPVLL